MSTINTPRPLAFSREFHHDLICSASRSGLVPLYPTNSTSESSSSFKFPSRPSSNQEAQVSTKTSDLKHDSITTEKPQHHRDLTITNPKPCLVIICVNCNKSTAWFSPPTPQSQPLVDPQTDDHHSTGSNHSSNILNTHSSTSSLNNSSSNQAPIPSPESLHQSSLRHGSRQPHSPFSRPQHPSTCPSLFPTSPKDQPTAPTWISGQIHGICSECQTASQTGSGLRHAKVSGDVLSHPSKPRPMSLLSDVTPLSASSCSSGSFPSSTSIPLDLDDEDGGHSLASSPSSAQVISVASVKPFRLSFPEVVSMRQRNLKPSTPPELPQLDKPDGSRHSPEHVIKLDLPPRRKARRGTPPTAVSESQTSDLARPDAGHTSEISSPPARSAPSAKRPATAATVTPASHSIVRQNSSHGLLGRFMSSPLMEFKRRPNTATGSSTHGPTVKTPSPTVEELRSPLPTPRPITPASHLTQHRTFASAPSLAAFQRPATATTPISPPFADAPAGAIRRPATGMGSRALDSLPTKSSGPLTFPDSTTPHDFSYIPSWTNGDQKRSQTAIQRVEPPKKSSRSVPSTPMNPKFKSNGSTPSGEIGLEAMKNPIQAHASVSKLPPEDFHSKSRSLTMSIFPRPSSDTFRPGQSLIVYLRRAPKKKFGTIGVVLSGRMIESRNGSSHEFMKVIKPVLTSGGVCNDARVIGVNGDEWAVEITIPEYATCACTPGPLPLPSAGSNPLGEVIYTIQLLAEKKQLISSQETILVKFHLTKAENRGIGSQLTTRPASVKSSKGKIVFGAGHLGSIEDYSLSHHLYFYHPERVEIFYAFEVRFGPHSNLPTQVIDQLAHSAKVELRYLIGEDKRMMKGVIDHRVRGWRPIENGWMINGSLEVKDVGALISPTTSTYSSNISHSTSANTFKQKKYEIEREKTSLKIKKELFLIVCMEESSQIGILNGKKLELSTLLGDTVLSKCPLRILGFQP
ncbi:uncharacterized protein MELLADRAFT_79592 [Melampsora larici-populina 98AG31]|uniref:Uncharacterized protein n=1 Tax=Melampsora larici-populina (strain 98AG31 / pathotype 3-4-7) TaxID=747676 RepID=F4S8Z8_MELLP|nr:uncharacterized protein MELLADRAFT_79592 [Melampsora larici-populina 98AG31]EGF98896.1 hypothetical protein MELLADRAFT_79592 [Melampsora larici-populina 98AG31]